MPPPAAMPIAAMAKIVAAVVSPTTFPPSRKITPAPRKPMPCTMLDAMRVVLVSPVRRAISTETTVKSAAPSDMQNPVRIPAGRRRALRSMPMMAPSKAAHARRATIELRGSMFSCNSDATAGFYTLQFELRQFREVACPGVYLAAFQDAETVEAEAFDGEAAHHRTIDHRAAERGVAQTLCAGEIAHEAAGEAVACAGGIVRFFERERRDAEDAAFVDHHGAVFAALY